MSKSSASTTASARAALALSLPLVSKALTRKVQSPGGTWALVIAVPRVTSVTGVASTQVVVPTGLKRIS